MAATSPLVIAVLAVVVAIAGAPSPTIAFGLWVMCVAPGVAAVDADLLAIVREVVAAVATPAVASSDAPRSVLALDAGLIAVLALVAIAWTLATRPASLPVTAPSPVAPAFSGGGGNSEKTPEKEGSKKTKKRAARKKAGKTASSVAPTSAAPSEVGTTTAVSTATEATTTAGSTPKGRKAKLGCPDAPSVPPQYRGKLTSELGARVKAAGRCPVCRRPLNKHTKPAKTPTTHATPSTPGPSTSGATRTPARTSSPTRTLGPADSVSVVGTTSPPRAPQTSLSPAVLSWRAATPSTPGPSSLFSRGGTESTTARRPVIPVIPGSAPSLVRFAPQGQAAGLLGLLSTMPPAPLVRPSSPAVPIPRATSPPVIRHVTPPPVAPVPTPSVAPSATRSEVLCSNCNANLEESPCYLNCTCKDCLDIFGQPDPDSENDPDGEVATCDWQGCKAEATHYHRGEGTEYVERPPYRCANPAHAHALLGGTWVEFDD